MWNCVVVCCFYVLVCDVGVGVGEFLCYLWDVVLVGV